MTVDEDEKRANARERQRRSRERRKWRGGREQEGEKPLSAWISIISYLALRRLAAHYGVTQRQVLEHLIDREDQVVTDGIERNSPEWQRYFGEQR
ncbi:hypothetical protein [Halorhodospira halophila]|uniref:hypothetical protein n=1 Tax=Halorhodospira halophila TaxID=1053 RepID=UPI001911A5BB|nr:hypothetical protein [Halorhodospira halophila]MBK5935480.1 hypothetical protein [Halorhodospira halophila]